ncbi:hypothetical protein ACJX0J_042549, partial [Zea mays]
TMHPQYLVHSRAVYDRYVQYPRYGRDGFLHIRKAGRAF